MNISLKNMPRILLVVATLFSAVLMSDRLLRAQTVPANAEEAIIPPAKEKFVESDDLVFPWRESDRACVNRVNYLGIGNIGDCGQLITVDVYLKATTLTLYNADGTVWYTFSISSKDPKSKYFRDNKKIGFKPFAAFPEDWPNTVVLRMVGESPHWYEVEINEQSSATKFVLKSDPMWAKTTWDDLFTWSFTLEVNQDRNKLRDKPDGAVIKDYADLHFTRLLFKKLDGDWVYVEGRTDSMSASKYGWIRWRKGREVIVGSILNDYKIPETK